MTRSAMALTLSLMILALCAPAFAQADGVGALKKELGRETIVEPGQPAANRAAVIGEFVRARKGPSTDSAILFDIQWGTAVEILGEENGFKKCRFPDGTVAYVAKQFIETKSKLLDRVPEWSDANWKKAESDFLVAYAAYTRSRTPANYETFKKAYQIYRELAQQSPALKAIRADAAGVSVVVDKATFTATVYKEGKAVRVFPVAYGANPDGASKQKVGDSRTPEGDFKIVNKERRPYEGVATRWMQLSTKWGDIGLHGTPMPLSIGSRASHGCVRMYSQDSLELFQLVRVGTPVSIRGVAKQ